MAIANRPFTEAELARLKDAISQPMLPNLDWLASMFDPRYCFVNYSASNGKSLWTPPEIFFWGPVPQPSDCVWMVPGTQS